MKVIYIGQYSEGTTSRMRAEQIKNILRPREFQVIDTHVPFYNTTSIFRSLGFRYKKGLLIKNVSSHIRNSLGRSQENRSIDLIWVDKAVFVTREITILLRKLTTKLIHFTPDPAFTYHKSKHFFNSIYLYDYVITTKSYELKHYKSAVKEEKIILTTQGFDKHTHRKIFSSKESDFIFLGHHEKEREKIIELLLIHGIKVKLAGIKWKKFSEKHKKNALLNYCGEGIYGNDYVKAIGNSKIAWGSISKWIPEKHTTRTFEIPACGTALLTERNKETTSFF